MSVALGKANNEKVDGCYYSCVSCQGGSILVPGLNVLKFSTRLADRTACRSADSDASFYIPHVWMPLLLNGIPEELLV